MNHTKSKLETVETLAARFSLPRRTVVREVMSSRLPYVSIAGNWRFRERDVAVWLERTGALPRLTLLAGGRERSAPSDPGALNAAGGATV